MSSPEGVFIDEPNRKWQISKQLGTGACGAVHELVKVSSSGSSSNVTYAIKLAKMPPGSINSNKKRKKSMAEKNADLLNHENLLYRNVLCDLRGCMIPDVPIPGTKYPNPAFGEIDGYRYLVMERMESPFEDIVPRLVSSASGLSSYKIPIGHIAARLVQLVQAVHATHHVFVDIKPGNFMLAHTPAAGNGKKTKSKSKSMPSNTIAQCIRMIDFGLMECTKDIMKQNKHRVNQYPNGPLVGTPTYASLNVLNGHTVSRRDDLEACSYVLLELILQIKAFVGGGNRAKVENNLLSWSRAKSDDEIRIMKENAMTGNDGGAFWDSIGADGNDKLRRTLQEFYTTVREMKFKESPEYEELICTLSTLELYVSAGASSSATLSSARSARSGREAVASPKRKKKSSRKKQIYIASESESESDYELESESQSIAGLKPSAKRAARLNVTSLSTTSPSTVSGRAARAYARSKAKFEIQMAEEETRERGQNQKRVEIQDLTQDDEDDSDIEMISMTEAHDDDEASFVSAIEQSSDMEWEVITDENESSSSNAASGKRGKNARTKTVKDTQRPHLRVECTEGPHKGEDFHLGGILLLGSNPPTRKGSGVSSSRDVFTISNDREASSSHAKLALVQRGNSKNGVLMVKVTDMKSKNGTFINDRKLPNGGSRQAFVNDTIRVGSTVFRILKK